MGFDILDFRGCCCPHSSGGIYLKHEELSMSLDNLKYVEPIYVAHLHRLDIVILVTFWVEVSVSWISNQDRHRRDPQVSAHVSSKEMRTQDVVDAVQGAFVLLVVQLGLPPLLFWEAGLSPYLFSFSLLVEALETHLCLISPRSVGPHNGVGALGHV